MERKFMIIFMLGEMEPGKKTYSTQLLKNILKRSFKKNYIIVICTLIVTGPIISLQKMSPPFSNKGDFANCSANLCTEEQ